MTTGRRECRNGLPPLRPHALTSLSIPPAGPNPAEPSRQRRRAWLVYSDRSRWLCARSAYDLPRPPSAGAQACSQPQAPGRIQGDRLAEIGGQRLGQFLLERSSLEMLAFRVELQSAPFDPACPAARSAPPAASTMPCRLSCATIFGQSPVDGPPLSAASRPPARPSHQLPRTAPPGRRPCGTQTPRSTATRKRRARRTRACAAASSQIRRALRARAPGRADREWRSDKTVARPPASAPQRDVDTPRCPRPRRAANQARPAAARVSAATAANSASTSR